MNYEIGKLSSLSGNSPGVPVFLKLEIFGRIQFPLIGNYDVLVRRVFTDEFQTCLSP